MRMYFPTYICMSYTEKLLADYFYSTLVVSIYLYICIPACLSYTIVIYYKMLSIH